MDKLMHVYTGDGKGKTTAALGLLMRTCGNGGNVIFAQFLKGRDTSERKVLEKLKGVCVIRLSKEYGFYATLTDEEKQELFKEHNCLLKQIRQKCQEETIDLLILDELTYVYNKEIADLRLIDELISDCKGKIELVITGRDAEPFIPLADYVTEMKKKKHPYDHGITARAGIEY